MKGEETVGLKWIRYRVSLGNPTRSKNSRSDFV